MTTTIKTCFKCRQAKLLSEFYKHPQMGDGHLNKCKECTKIDSTRHRWSNIERIRFYDRSRGIRGNPNDWRTPEKARANNMVRRAIKSGKLEKWPCQICGESRSEAHHISYAKGMELSVTWLCSAHHKQAHRDTP